MLIFNNVSGYEITYFRLSNLVKYIGKERKSLDKKIVLNSMILKWDNIKEEFSKLIKI